MISLPQLSKGPPGEGCGSCTACCDLIGVVELGKPYYARCVHLGKGCEIYEQRPAQCREYRCAWHLGLLGPRVDRRPDQCGVMFQLEPEGGRWYVGIYEVSPGAAASERARYLKDIILASKGIRHLPMGHPAVRVYPFGADLPLAYETSANYDYQRPAGASAGDVVPMKNAGGQMVFDGPCRELLMPKGKS